VNDRTILAADVETTIVCDKGRVMRLFKQRSWALLLSAISLSSAATAYAQFGPPGGRGGLGGGRGGFDANPSFVLRREDVQTELKLTEEQKKEIQAQQDFRNPNPKMTEFFERMRTANEDERRAIGEEMRAYSESELKRILKPEQFTRLQQLSFQRQGARALENEDTAKLLNLTDDQKAKVKAATDEYDKARDGFRDLSREDREAKFEELRAKRDKALEAPFEGPLVDAMKNAILKLDPEALPVPYLMSGGTDNKALSDLGIVGYGYSPLKLPADLDFMALFHGVDERVPLESLEFGVNSLQDCLLNS